MGQNRKNHKNNVKKQIPKVKFPNAEQQNS